MEFRTFSGFLILLGSAMTWFVYILECRDGELYTGCTKDVSRRVQEHNTGAGSKFTRGRLPVKLLYQEQCPDRSAAQRREFEIKRMRKRAKLTLILAGHEPIGPS
jgi:predicted GIY-YIG superfamily endonuclease